MSSRGFIFQGEDFDLVISERGGWYIYAIICSFCALFLVFNAFVLVHGGLHLDVSGGRREKYKICER